ncbi:hypothetical protein [Burkholderia gladioli]|nr:hypothetical protein [Burkholderia gladioli]
MPIMLWKNQHRGNGPAEPLTDLIRQRIEKSERAAGGEAVLWRVA